MNGVCDFCGAGMYPGHLSGCSGLNTIIYNAASNLGNAIKSTAYQSPSNNGCRFCGSYLAYGQEEIHLNNCEHFKAFITTSLKMTEPLINLIISKLEESLPKIVQKVMVNIQTQEITKQMEKM